MLYIVTKDALHTTEEHSWHVGMRNPMICVDNVVEVQADGDELRHILYREPLFRCNGQVIRFFGDDAKFIVANSLK